MIFVNTYFNQDSSKLLLHCYARSQNNIPRLHNNISVRKLTKKILKRAGMLHGQPYWILYTTAEGSFCKMNARSVEVLLHFKKLHFLIMINHAVSSSSK